MKSNYYFDNAGTTWPKPEPVYTFMDEFFRSYGVVPARSGNTMSENAEGMIHETRQMLAAFFGYSGNTNRVVFTLNGTDSLNTAISGLLTAGDHIITTRIEHNAVLRIVNHLERDHQISVTRIPVNKDGYIDVNDISKATTPATKMMVLNHASNVIGTVQPLEQVASVAKDNGLLLVVDTAQSAGLLPIDMTKLGIDVLTFTGHKGLFGPMGVGGLIVAEHVDINPHRFGGTGAQAINAFQPDDFPYRLEAGTAPLPGIAGLHAAQKWFQDTGLQQQKARSLPATTDHQLLCQYAVQHIHNVEIQHLNRIASWLKAFPEINMLGNAVEPERIANLSFTVRSLSSEQVGDRLNANHGVRIRAGLHGAPLVHVDAGTAASGGALRISPGYFTDEQDMLALKNALDCTLHRSH